MSRYVILTVNVFVSSCKHKCTQMFLHLHIKLLEVGDAVYQKMATHSENYGQWLEDVLQPFNPILCRLISSVYFVALFPYVHVPYRPLSPFNTTAVTLITILRDGQGYGEPETTSLKQEHDPVQSQRIVLPPQNQRRRSKKSPRNTSLKEETENSSSFFDGYIGTKPLIGEYRWRMATGDRKIRKYQTYFNMIKRYEFTVGCRIRHFCIFCLLWRIIFSNSETFWEIRLFVFLMRRSIQPSCLFGKDVA